MKNLASGNVPHTIDAAGNVIPKPYGASRWATPRVRACKHDNCTTPAFVLRSGDGITKTHNCCAHHKEGAES